MSGECLPLAVLARNRFQVLFFARMLQSSSSSSSAAFSATLLLAVVVLGELLLLSKTVGTNGPLAYALVSELPFSPVCCVLPLRHNVKIVDHGASTCVCMGVCAHAARNTVRTTGYGTSTCVCMGASAHVMRNTVRTTGYRVSCASPTQHINDVTTNFSTMSPQRFRNDFTTIPQRPRIATAGTRKN